ncbi:MAG: hypothetical protein U9N35_04890 [Euryarchaeota archaeon]|nr:hypothetical protein [Euryarchaeota archaeon]
MLISILIILVVSRFDIGKKISFPFLLSIGALMVIVYELEIEDKKLIEPILAAPISVQRFILGRMALLTVVFLLAYIILGGIYYLLEGMFSVRYLLVGVLASCLPNLRKRTIVFMIILLLIIMNTKNTLIVFFCGIVPLILFWNDLKKINKEEFIEKKEY